ncbi:MAG: 2,4-dienoyl-CoA reductase [Acidobacteria bacterium]|nr:2,4-dienoyl-CoA reductase [Acidobacteriota bacterium]
MLPANTLQGQVAIVTGGGTGLGRAMALEYARLGAKLVLASRNPEHLEPTVAEIQRAGGEAIAVPTDVRDPAQVDRMVQQTKERFGGIDILVNNAAGNFLCKAEELSPNGWRAVVDIVLNGTFFCSRAVGREMIAQRRGGKILSILAPYAWTGGPGTVHSAAAKAGVLALTRTLAVEWAPYKIRVNAIAPGPVATEGASSRLWGDPEAEKRLLSTIPVGRVGTPQEIAYAAAYLVSPYADFINGEALTIDGGSWLGRGFLAVQTEDG